MMQRVLIIGGNGAGKTTFSRELSNRLKLPLTHLDSLYWKDNWESATIEEFDILLSKELNKDSWILDGNMARTLPTRLKYSDTVIYFDFSRYICLFGILKRYFLNIGRSMPDKASHCPERISWAFIKGTWNFNLKNRGRFYQMLQDEPELNVIILKNRKQVREFLNSL